MPVPAGLPACRERGGAEAEDGEEVERFDAVTKLMAESHGRAAAMDYLNTPPKELWRDRSFRNQLNELWRNFLIVVAMAYTRDPACPEDDLRGQG